MAKNINFTIDAGAEFSFDLPAVKDADGDVINLTDYVIDAVLKRSYYTKTAGVEFTTSAPSPTSGVINLSLDASDTVELTPGRYVYDVFITSAAPISSKVFEGTIEIKPSVTLI